VSLVIDLRVDFTKTRYAYTDSTSTFTIKKLRGNIRISYPKIRADLKFLHRIISSVVDCLRKPRAMRISSVVDCRRKFGGLGVTGDGSREEHVEEESGDFLEPRRSSVTCQEEEYMNTH